LKNGQEKVNETKSRLCDSRDMNESASPDSRLFVASGDKSDVIVNAYWSAVSLRSAWMQMCLAPSLSAARSQGESKSPQDSGVQQQQQTLILVTVASARQVAKTLGCLAELIAQDQQSRRTLDLSMTTFLVMAVNRDPMRQCIVDSALFTTLPSAMTCVGVDWDCFSPSSKTGASPAESKESSVQSGVCSPYDCATLCALEADLISELFQGRIIAMIDLNKIQVEPSMLQWAMTDLVFTTSASKSSPAPCDLDFVSNIESWPVLTLTSPSR
jgi:hypothetical protein